MAYRAVIYIRTSSETQCEKPSPVEQETDCLRLAQEKDLKVVRIYRDVEKYKVLMHGMETLLVDEHHTTQTCPNCGSRKSRADESIPVDSVVLWDIEML